MPKSRTPLTPEAESILAQLADVDSEWRDLGRTLEARLRAQLERELRAVEVKRAILAHQASEAKAPVSRIAAALHTSARITAYKAIEEGALYAPGRPAESGADAPEFSLDGDVLTVTPPADALARVLEAFPDAAASVTSAQFRVEDDGFLNPLTPAQTDAGINPVIMLMDGSREYLARAHAWLRAHRVEA